MRLFLINYFSVTVLIIFAILLFLASGFLTYFLSRRFFPNFLISSFADSGSIYRILTASNAILFAFTIIVLWQTFNTAKSVVADEANGLIKLMLDAKALPPADTKKIDDAVINYRNSIINVEWPEMRWGNSSDKTREALFSLNTILQKYIPKNVSEEIYYKELVADYSKVFSARRARVGLLGSVIPNTLYVMIVISLFLTLFAACLMSDKDRRSHLTLIALMSVVMGFNLALITIFDFPFSGEISVSNAPLYAWYMAFF